MTTRLAPPRGFPLRLTLAAALAVAAALSMAAFGDGRAASGPPVGPKAPLTAFECRWARGPIAIDGQADEPAWKHAQVIDNFSLPWLGKKARAARTATKA